MSRNRPVALDLAHRLCRPQRIGLFGRRGVGKTTLLTMLYREGVGGRLPGLRLAAGDDRTARYLGERILQLENGEMLPATLDQTELNFHLYHAGNRIEIVLLDYQGEHVALGRREAIREFLHGCDAVWLCLDAPLANDQTGHWLAEQEAEQIVEDYLGSQPEGETHRPMAMVVTKADLLEGATDVAAVRALSERMLSMTRHTLQTHCPWQGVFAISSLGSTGVSSTGLQPTGLEAPLIWLAQSLFAQDEVRLERLWQLAPNDLSLLTRATQAFVRRYPEAASSRDWQQRLQRAQRQRWLRRSLLGATCVLTLALALWGYDAWGARRLSRTLAEQTEMPQEQLQTWRDYQTWYPTRYLFRSASVASEREHITDLQQVILENERQERLTQLRRQADDPDANPEVVWSAFVQLRSDYPNHDLDEEQINLRSRIKQAADQRRNQRAEKALRELDRLQLELSLEKLLAQATTLMNEHAGTTSEGEFLRRKAQYERRIDESAYERAKDYSTRQPLNFYTRKQKYQEYLDRHPDGVFARQARSEIVRVVEEWDKHDYRTIRDLYTSKPGDVQSLRNRGREYLTAHAEGKYRKSIQDLIAWCDRVNEVGEYTVTVKSGWFSKKAAHMISRGVSPSVEIEVGGVRYGPTTIVTRSYTPEWNYEFSRKVKWKLGDSVRIIVTDNYFWKRKIGDLSYEEEPLAMQHLNEEVEMKLGSVTFSSDFTLPNLPRVE